MSRHFAQLPSREMAITLINYEALVDEAYEAVYGKTILRDIRRPLMWLVAFVAKYGRWPCADELNKRIQEANDCSEPTARGQIKRGEDQGLYSSEEDGVKTFYYLEPEEFEKLKQLVSHLALIPAVVAKQIADPKNPTAGIELLPSGGGYYNVIQLMTPDNDNKADGDGDDD